MSRKLWLTLVLVLIGAVSLGLLGCGGSEEASVTTATPGTSAPSEGGTTTETTAAVAEITYPEKPIKIIIHAGVGGSTDVPVRALIPYLEKQLGVSVVAENVDGAGGRKARAQLYKAEPDGYILGTLTIPSIYLGEKLYDGEYDSEKYTYIGNVGGNDYRTLIVKKGSDIKTWDDFVKKAEEGTLVVAQGGGLGATAHLQSVLIKQVAGVDHNTIPVKSASEVLAQVLGGHADAGLVSSSDSVRYADQVDTIAVHAPEPLPELPGVPTFKELGFEGMEIPYMTGVGGPPGMPEEIVQILSNAFYAAVTDPGYVQWAKDTGVSLQPLTGPDFSEAAFQSFDVVATNIDMIKADIAAGEK